MWSYSLDLYWDYRLGPEGVVLFSVFILGYRLGPEGVVLFSVFILGYRLVPEGVVLISCVSRTPITCVWLLVTCLHWTV